MAVLKPFGTFFLSKRRNQKPWLNPVNNGFSFT
jgi:hypothetical protein